MWHRVPPFAVAGGEFWFWSRVLLVQRSGTLSSSPRLPPVSRAYTQACLVLRQAISLWAMVLLSFDLSYLQHVLTTSLSVHHRHHDSLGIDISSSRPHLVGEATRDLRPEDRAHAAWGMTAHPEEKDIPSHLIFYTHHAPRHGPGHVGVTKCALGKSEPKPYRYRGDTGDGGRTEYLMVRVGS